MNSSLDAVGGAETATERLQLELEQLRSELDSCSTRLHLTEKLLAQVQDAVFVAELDGRIIDVNPAACSLLGYERQELLKMRCHKRLVGRNSCLDRHDGVGRSRHGPTRVPMQKR